MYSLYTVQLYSTNMLRVRPVEVAVNKAVIEVEGDVHVNAEETHDESDKGTVAQSVYNREV